MASSVEKVRRAYNQKTRSLRMYTPWLKENTAMKAVQAVGRYNAFQPERVAGAIERIAESDPNARFSVGREGSPVVYVETRKPQVAIGVFGNMPPTKRPDELDKGPFRSGAATMEHPKPRSGHSLVRAWWD